MPRHVESRKAVIERILDYHRTLEKENSKLWVLFAMDVDMFIDVHDIQGDNKDDVLDKAFKMMKKEQSWLRRYKFETLRTRYYAKVKPPKLPHIKG
jgi:hypothetical protein